MTKANAIKIILEVQKTVSKYKEVFLKCELHCIRPQTELSALPLNERKMYTFLRALLLRNFICFCFEPQDELIIH